MVIYCYLLLLTLNIISTDGLSIGDRNENNNLVPPPKTRLDLTRKDANSLKIVSNEPFIIQLQMPEGQEKDEKAEKRKRPMKKRLSKLKALRKKRRERRDIRLKDSKLKSNTSSKLNSRINDTTNSTDYQLLQQEMFKVLDDLLEIESFPKKIKSDEPADPEVPEIQKKSSINTNKSIKLDQENVDRKIKNLHNDKNTVRARRRAESDKVTNKMAKMFLTLSAVTGLQDKKKNKCKHEQDDEDWMQEKKNDSPKKNYSVNEERYKVKKWIEHLKQKRSSPSCPCMNSRSGEEESFPLEGAISKEFRQKNKESDESAETDEKNSYYNQQRGTSTGFSKSKLKNKLLRKSQISIEDLELYRSRAKQILRNAQEILERLKEEEERRLAAPPTTIEDLPELTPEMRGEPRSDENAVIQFIQKNLKNEGVGNPSTFIQKLKSLLMTPFQKARAMTDENNKQLNGYLLKNLGKWADPLDLNNKTDFTEESKLKNYNPLGLHISSNSKERFNIPIYAHKRIEQEQKPKFEYEKLSDYSKSMHSSKEVQFSSKNYHNESKTKLVQKARKEKTSKERSENDKTYFSNESEKFDENEKETPGAKQTEFKNNEPVFLEDGFRENVQSMRKEKDSEEGGKSENLPLGTEDQVEKPQKDKPVDLTKNIISSLENFLKTDPKSDKEPQNLRNQIKSLLQNFLTNEPKDGKKNRAESTDLRAVVKSLIDEFLINESENINENEKIKNGTELTGHKGHSKLRAETKGNDFLPTETESLRQGEKKLDINEPTKLRNALNSLFETFMRVSSDGSKENVQSLRNEKSSETDMKNTEGSGVTNKKNQTVIEDDATKNHLLDIAETMGLFLQNFLKTGSKNSTENASQKINIDPKANENSSKKNENLVRFENILENDESTLESMNESLRKEDDEDIVSSNEEPEKIDGATGNQKRGEEIQENVKSSTLKTSVETYLESSSENLQDQRSEIEKVGDDEGIIESDEKIFNAKERSEEIFENASPIESFVESSNKDIQDMRKENDSGKVSKDGNKVGSSENQVEELGNKSLSQEVSKSNQSSILSSMESLIENFLQMEPESSKENIEDVQKENASEKNNVENVAESDKSPLKPEKRDEGNENHKRSEEESHEFPNSGHTSDTFFEKFLRIGPENSNENLSNMRNEKEEEVVEIGDPVESKERLNDPVSDAPSDLRMEESDPENTQLNDEENDSKVKENILKAENLGEIDNRTRSEKKSEFSGFGNLITSFFDTILQNTTGSEAEQKAGLSFKEKLSKEAEKLKEKKRTEAEFFEKTDENTENNSNSEKSATKIRNEEVNPEVVELTKSDENYPSEDTYEKSKISEVLSENVENINQKTMVEKIKEIGIESTESKKETEADNEGALKIDYSDAEANKDQENKDFLGITETEEKSYEEHSTTKNEIIEGMHSAEVEQEQEQDNEQVQEQEREQEQDNEQEQEREQEQDNEQLQEQDNEQVQEQEREQEQDNEQLQEQVQEQEREQEQDNEQIQQQDFEQVQEQEREQEQDNEQLQEQDNEQIQEQDNKQVQEQDNEQIQEQDNEQVQEQSGEQEQEQNSEQEQEQDNEQVQEQSGEQEQEQDNEQEQEQDNEQEQQQDNDQEQEQDNDQEQDNEYIKSVAEENEESVSNEEYQSESSIGNDISDETPLESMKQSKEPDDDKLRASNPYADSEEQDEAALREEDSFFGEILSSHIPKGEYQVREEKQQEQPFTKAKASKFQMPKTIEKIMESLEGNSKEDLSIQNMDSEKIDHFIDKIDEAERQNSASTEVDCVKECKCADKLDMRSRNAGRYEIVKDFLHWMKDLQLNRVLSDN